MKAVIIAGGKGTRMGNLSREIPKSMIRIGGKPLIEHQIELLKKYNIKDITIITGYLSEVIENYFKNGNEFGVNISYFKEGKFLGTTGGLKEIERQLKEDFIVMYGDVMINMDIDRLINFHKKKKGTGTLVIHPNDHPYDSDLLDINEDQKVISFYRKPHNKNRYFRNLVNACVYIFSPKILKCIKKGVKADFGKNVFPKIIKSEALYGYNTAEYLKDMGTLERLKEVRRDYKSGKVARFNRERKRKAIFLDRDGVINREIDLLHKIKDFKFLSNIDKAIKRINQSEFLSIVITNQPVVARNLCSIKELEKIHKKMETLLGQKRAKLDAIYYCPHHPDKGFPEENSEYKISCNCRKPKIGLVKKAEKDFNIDLKHSYFIGDSSRDILCGKSAGLVTVGVRTGKGCRDSNVKPDYLVDNLYKAVSLIMKKDDNNKNTI